MEWPAKLGNSPPEPTYAAACTAMGAGFVLIPVALGAYLNDAPMPFWAWFAGGGALAAAFYGLVLLLEHFANTSRTANPPAQAVDNWRPAFSDEEYAEIRDKVPFAGIWDSGGPGYSDYSERVDEILYGKTPSGPPPIVFSSAASAVAAPAADRPAPPRRRSAASR